MHRIRMSPCVIHLYVFLGEEAYDGYLDDLVPACLPAACHTTMCKVCEIWVSYSSLLGYDAISLVNRYHQQSDVSQES